MILKHSSNKILLVLGYCLYLCDMRDVTLVGFFLKCHAFFWEEVWDFWLIGNVSHYYEPPLQPLFLPTVEITPYERVLLPHLHQILSQLFVTVSWLQGLICNYHFSHSFFHDLAVIKPPILQRHWVRVVLAGSLTAGCRQNRPGSGEVPHEPWYSGVCCCSKQSWRNWPEKQQELVWSCLTPPLKLPALIAFSNCSASLGLAVSQCCSFQAKWDSVTIFVIQRRNQNIKILLLGVRSHRNKTEKSGMKPHLLS